MNAQKDLIVQACNWESVIEIIKVQALGCEM